MTKIIIEVNEKLHEEFKIECAKQGDTQRSVATHLIQKWIDKKKRV